MEKNILALLEKLVEFRSVSSDKEEGAKIINYVADYLNNENVFVKRYSNDGFASLLVYSKNHTINKPFRLLLNAHLDVVPASQELFKLKIKGNKAFGRGTYDMKGSAAAMIELFKNLSEKNELPDDVGLLLVTDEEIGGFSGAKLFSEKKDAETRFFLGGEPTNMKILTAHKGILKITVTQRGKSAHGSRPWEGSNANVTLAESISRFYKDNPIPKKEMWATTYSLNLMNGGTAFNVVSDYAEATFDIRRIYEDKSEKIISTIKKYFPQAEIKVVMNEPGLETNSIVPEVKKLAQILKKYNKGKNVFIRDTYATDGRFYSAKKIPAIHFGLKGGCMHQEGEWVDIKSLSPYYKALQEFLLHV